MQSMRLRKEHTGLLIGVVLAGIFLGVWHAGGVGAARAATRAGLGLHLSGYQGLGRSGALGFVGAPADAAAPADAPANPAVGSASGDPYDVVGPPTLSAALIDTILSEYGSPAVGQGAVFAALGRQYGIDPAFALAFYVHESAAGTKGVARFTHGIGNIRTTPGYADYEGYRSYATFAAGIEDWFKLIRELYVDGWGLRTVATILPRYAPPADNNDTASYIADVQTLVTTWRARQ
jgi:hypothetical protein